jgi:hypothetical protein
MSRIGKLPIQVPAGVDVTIDGRTVAVKGPKGTLSHTVVEPSGPCRLPGLQDLEHLIERPESAGEDRDDLPCLMESLRSCDCW